MRDIHHKALICCMRLLINNYYFWQLATNYSHDSGILMQNPQETTFNTASAMLTVNLNQKQFSFSTASIILDLQCGLSKASKLKLRKKLGFQYRQISILHPISVLFHNTGIGNIVQVCKTSVNAICLAM